LKKHKIAVEFFVSFKNLGPMTSHALSHTRPKIQGCAKENHELYGDFWNIIICYSGR